MGEDHTSGHSQPEQAGKSGESGWVTTDVAAKAVRISPRTIRRYIDQAKLEAKPQGKGVRREWLVSVDSLHALRASRTIEEDDPDVGRGIGYADSLADVLREMSARLESRAEEAAELRVRLELTERAQSSLEDERHQVQQDLEEEHRRREEAERERDEIRQELFALREARESSQTVEKEPERAEPRPATGGAQEGTESRSDDGPPLLRGYLVGVVLSMLATPFGAMLDITSSFVFREAYYESLLGNLLFFLILTLVGVPAIPGYRLGRKLRGLRFWRQVAPIGALVGLGSVLAVVIVYVTSWWLLPNNFRAILTWPTLVVAGVAGPLYTFAAVFGNAIQRRNRGRLAEERPSGSPPDAASAAQDGSPRQQAIVGLVGTISAALIGLVGTIVSVLNAGNGG